MGPMIMMMRTVEGVMGTVAVACVLASVSVCAGACAGVFDLYLAVVAFVLLVGVVCVACDCVRRCREIVRLSIVHENVSRARSFAVSDETVHSMTNRVRVSPRIKR